MLFSYNKEKGFNIGGTGLSTLFTNENQNILNSGNNKNFLDVVQNDWNSSNFDANSIQARADALGNVNKQLVLFCQEEKAAGADGANLEKVWLSQGSALGKLKGAFASLGQVGLSALAALGNAVVSFGISLAVTAAVSWFSNLIDKMIITKKEAKELANTFNDSFSSMTKEQSETRKTLDGLDEEFKELSKGVDILGRNVGLTEEEFERYHEITQIIADKVPSMIDGYDAQGEAIIRLKGNVESLSEAYRESNQQAAYQLYNKVDDKGTSITKGAYENVNDFIKDNSKHGLSLEETRKTYEQMASMDYHEIMALFDDDRMMTQLQQDILTAAGINIGTTEQEFLATAHAKIRQEYQNFEAEFASHQKTLSNLASEYAQSLPDYWAKYTDSTREYINAALNNLDFDTLSLLGITDENGKIYQDDIESFVVSLMEQFRSIPSDKMGKIDERINIVTSFNNNEIPYGEYQRVVNETNEWLTSLPEQVQTMLRLIFNIDGDDAEIQRAKDYLKLLLGDNYSEDFANSLTKEQLSRVYDIDIKYKPQVEKKYDDKGFEIKPEIKPYSTDYIKKQLEDEVSPIEVEAKVKSIDTVDAMAELKSAVSSLGDLYNQTVNDQLILGKDKKYVDAEGNVNKQINDKGQVIGFADPEAINSIESAFSKFITTMSENGKDVTKMDEALQRFENTLVTMPGDADAAQAAYNDLITAYIDSTDILDGLTEETAVWCTAILEGMDIENADIVVKSRLNKTTKDLSKGYAKLRDAIEKYNQVMAEGTADEAQDSIQDITDQLNDMYGFTGKKGQQVNPFDTEFVSQNIAMINEALDDTTGKFNELDRMAAKSYILDLIVNTHDQDISAMYNGLYNLMATFDGESIDIGTSMDGTPIYATLESIRQAIGKAGKDWADMVSQMTGGVISAKMEFEQKDVKLNLPQINTAQYNNRYADHSAGSHVDYIQDTVHYNLPKFTYTYTGKGATANYKPSAPASSGGGGGGGGGGGSSSEPNKPKEEAEETFDWIEVAIQRIEEEIARLDKVVGNSYDAWIRRNEALLKEINKTKDEIKAQQLAQEEYLRNANKVQVNNGRGLNPDDYGENDQLVKAQDQKLLDEAKKAWATGQYQKKVREGLLTGDDIENIQNHFLSDTVRFFQELYNKSVQAGDAVQDLKIKLGELARTNFDHVKSEYEETLAYFDAYSSLIDERINRTEEKGYFVSKKYYSDLIAYDNKSLNALQKEYNDLIKKRDEAVTSGAILSGSSEWNAMNQEILDVANSIEQATTKLVEFSNQMRQIDWDVFDFLQDRIGKVNDEFEFLVDLLDNQKLYDDWGMFNERGWADTALHASKYNTYMQQALDYAKEREKIEGELAKNRADKNLIERREELIQLQQESIKNAYAEKEAVKDLVSEGINLHLQKLQELIDEYKKSLSEARNLYDYQKNIAKQTENIGNLRKQLNAYAGDTSEEARATIQRLNQQLKDAEQSLQETEWDKYISETQTFLDDMYKDYEETLNKRLDDIDFLMHDMIDSVNGRGGEIRDIINTVSGEVGYRLTENANTFLKNGTLVSDFKTNFDTYATTTEKMLNDIKNYVSSISNKTVAEGINNTEKLQNPTRVNGFNTTYKGVDYGSVFDLNYYMQKYPDLVKAFGNDYDKYLEHFVNHGMKEGRRASETFDVQYYRSKYADLNGHWGNDWEQYFKHFLNHGIQEGRQGSAEFDVQKYKASYADLQKSLGDVLGRYYKHYNQYGIGEGRKGNTFIRDGIDYSPVFDPKYYADRWSDLKKWYGYDSTKLFNHFVDHGMKEGRQASANFNPAKYKEYYNDLAKSYGNDWKKYFMHYLNQGIFEGRRGYKVGAHNISTAQMAWTQEAGGELIYRSTDGAILTPLNVGDKVFTAEMSENLWNLAQLKQRPFVPTNTGGKTINNTNAISITLPNVQNYEQFKTAMQNDPKMTQFIQQITLGEATNGVKLNKKRY